MWNSWCATAPHRPPVPPEPHRPDTRTKPANQRARRKRNAGRPDSGCTPCRGPARPLLCDRTDHRDATRTCAAHAPPRPPGHRIRASGKPLNSSQPGHVDRHITSKPPATNAGNSFVMRRCPARGVVHLCATPPRPRSNEAMRCGGNIHDTRAIRRSSTVSARAGIRSDAAPSRPTPTPRHQRAGMCNLNPATKTSTAAHSRQLGNLNLPAAPLSPGANSTNRTLTERWPSGRRRTPGKCVGGKPSPGFESLSLRHLPPRKRSPDPAAAGFSFCSRGLYWLGYSPRSAKTARIPFSDSQIL